MKTSTITNCSKCDGVGRIQAYAGIAGGVCFRCGGSGKVKSSNRTETMIKPLTEYHAAMIATIETGDVSGMSFSELQELRNVAMFPVPQSPNINAIWYDRCEPFFQVAQTEMRERSMSNTRY